MKNKFKSANSIECDRKRQKNANKCLPDVTELEAELDYRFKDKNLIIKALRHRSYANEQAKNVENNERLEFLGDAVLGLAISHGLMERLPNFPEGVLSRIRAQLVSSSTLAEIAKRINLGRFILLGRGELLSHGEQKPSILADTMEAVFGAVYSDGGFDKALSAILKIYEPLLAEIKKKSINEYITDYKTLLQELTQERFQQLPEYELTDAQGPDHDKTFSVSVIIPVGRFNGTGKSKKAAQQDAARRAYEHLTTK